MEAANRGAADVEAKSIGLNIVLPKEQQPNRYITLDLCFQFHYFAIRKMHFLLRAKVLVVFPGGFGTLDELFDALTLRRPIECRKYRSFSSDVSIGARSLISNYWPTRARSLTGIWSCLIMRKLLRKPGR